MGALRTVSGLLAAVVLGCGGYSTETGEVTYNPPPPGGNPQPSATIQVLDNFYSPATVLIAAGGTVTWNWGGSGHSVTSSGSPSFSPTAPISNAPHTLGPVTFATAGTYEFYCTAHGVSGTYGGGQMTGAVF